ncbi:hypothetical protein JOC77_002021 [Peribacillus deserti]|uniref:Uncharacterized protein n=1 Tax=Peribacillus deserti TaxID=673318 RepID=A0ABS2QJX7_9BACI|nr:hypothetical protein [Peribacillus deserti]MBM7692591.1 hypothetical protein [Peribacillus deserti]
MELAGICSVCGKEIYCRDGFLDGVIDQKSGLLCYACTDLEIWENKKEIK